MLQSPWLYGAGSLLIERLQMSDEKSTTTEIEQQRLKAGLVLKQAATICKANRDALVAVCKQKAPAVAGDDQRAGVLVEFMVQILNKYGHLLNPRISSGGRKGEEKLTKEEVRAMMHRSGRALRNAASICKSNRDMLARFFLQETGRRSERLCVCRSSGRRCGRSFGHLCGTFNFR